MKNLYIYVCKMESVMMDTTTPQHKLNTLFDIKREANNDKNLDGIAYNILCKLYTSYAMACETMHNK